MNKLIIFQDQIQRFYQSVTLSCAYAEILQMSYFSLLIHTLHRAGYHRDNFCGNILDRGIEENMDSMIFGYKHRLNLQAANFVKIDHEEAMVATVYKIIKPSGEEFILKICSRKGDYLREAYFLNHFQGKLPVPRIIQLLPPDGVLDGAILMECLKGDLLKKENLEPNVCYEMGLLLAQIHLDPIKSYGDLTDPDQLSSDPRVPFTQKFEEAVEECRDHLPLDLLTNVRRYYQKHIDLLLLADGPCITHRDYRPGNIIVHQGKVQGVIDWSAARGGFAEQDFCPLEFGEWSNHHSCKDAFLSGYAKIRKIPDYQRIMPLLRLSKALGAIGFTIKRGTWQGKGLKLYQSSFQYLEKFLEKY